MRVHLIGGFLGAGKTTLIRSLARHLAAKGEQVAVVTNDQGHALVDTVLCSSEIKHVSEIPGGCFCCRYDDLADALRWAKEQGATVAIAEAVGSCTDLIATVLSPLSQSSFDLAPLTVVVDPWRLQQVEQDVLHATVHKHGGVHEDVAYLFRKQIQEADVLVISRADLDPPDIRSQLEFLASDAAILPVSGKTGAGIDAWLDARPKRPAVPLDVDYARYAAAEALLGWSNGVVHLSRSEGFDPAQVMHDFMVSFSDTDVAHVKMVSIDPEGGSGSLVRRGSTPILETINMPALVKQASFVVNARIAMTPADLTAHARRAMTHTLPGGKVEWTQWECFSPSAPDPTHRHAFRCGTGDDASCCAAFYDRSEVRYLLGDSLHPGGVELTLKMAQYLDLSEGKKILDVACGQGTSLKAVRHVWPVQASGMDAGIIGPKESKGTPGAINFFQGDAHNIPFDTNSFDAILCECALSTFADQKAALREMHRVLKKGGRIALSDMVVEGEVPEPLKDWVNVGTCLEGALRYEGYKRVIEEAGFQVVEHWNASDSLREMMSRIKRNLLGMALAKASGNLADNVKIDVKEGRKLLREAAQAINDGVIGYGVYIAGRLESHEGESQSLDNQP